MWAIGIMFFAMMYGRLPFYSKNEKDLIKSIKNDPVRFSHDVAITAEGKDILKSMLNKDPKKRLELIELMNMPYALWDSEDLDKKL